MQRKTGDKMKGYLKAKQTELIWALALQDFTYSDIGIIFGIKHRSTVLRTVRRRPKDWSPKWKKVRE